MSEHQKIDLTTFILSVSSAACFGLGISEEGSAGEIDFELARQNIDILELLQDKTRGNRSPEEDRLLEQLLFETRMRYVEAQRKSMAK